MIKVNISRLYIKREHNEKELIILIYNLPFFNCQTLLFQRILIRKHICNICSLSRRERNSTRSRLLRRALCQRLNLTQMLFCKQKTLRQFRRIVRRAISNVRFKYGNIYVIYVLSRAESVTRRGLVSYAAPCANDSTLRKCYFASKKLCVSFVVLSGAQSSRLGRFEETYHTVRRRSRHSRQRGGRDRAQG